MFQRRFWLLFFAAILAVVASGNKDMHASGIYARVLGQSGKIQLGRTDPPSEDDDGITVTMSSIKEVDADGNEVGKQGAKVQQHVFNTFATEDFTFTDLVDVEYQGVPAVNFNFTTTMVSDEADFQVSLYIFTDSGTIGSGNHTTEVENGTMKFDVLVDNWPFCDGNDAGACSNGDVGAALIFEISVKSRSDASALNDTMVFSLGGGAVMELRTDVEVDGATEEMDDGYPSVETSGENTDIKFKFPRGAHIAYDPSFWYDSSSGGGGGEGGDDDDDGGGGGGGNGVAASVPAATGLLLAGAVLLALVH